MLNFGAFAGGLAQGIRSGGEMDLKRQLAERATRADEREAEIHPARMDKAAFHKDKRDRLRAANDEIAAAWGEPLHLPAPALAGAPDWPVGSAGLVKTVRASPDFEQSVAPSSAEILPPETSGTRTDNGTANNGSEGLMSLHEKSAAQKNHNKTPIAADEIIGRRMLTGNLLEDADELTRMANIYKKHRLLEEMAPWMNKVYAAKKKRIPDALHFLLTGDANAAREALKRGGINLADDPVAENPNDPQDHNWRFRLENGSKQNVNLKELAADFFPSALRR